MTRGTESDPSSSRASSVNVDERMRDGEGMLRAMQSAVREALLTHKKLGRAIFVAENGEVVEIAPEDIPVGDGD